MPDVKQFVIFLSLVGIGIGWSVAKKMSAYSTGHFFQPQIVKDIADQLPTDNEDDFIYSAWKMVGDTPYEAIGSAMDFVKGEVYCADCYFPAETLERNEGNCVAKSSLLASILANRISSKRIQIVVGKYVGEGGHAWVELWRDNAWYLLESTKSPDRYEHPWMIADGQYAKYKPEMIMESDSLRDVSNEDIESMIGCDCGIDKIYRK
jgi:hypothetical protein